MSWQLQEAKNKLSKVVEEARKSGPQVITVRGKEAAVVLSIEEYRRIAPKQESLGDFLLRSPLHGSGIVIEREQDFDREVDL
jgi:prevent-host-death family protein